jgi:hypothetical protein
MPGKDLKDAVLTQPYAGLAQFQRADRGLKAFIDSDIATLVPLLGQSYPAHSVSVGNSVRPRREDGALQGKLVLQIAHPER